MKKIFFLLFSMEGETIKMMNQDLVRLDRFDGTNFTRWQDKVRFLLTTLKIAYILESTLGPYPHLPTRIPMRSRHKGIREKMTIFYVEDISSTHSRIGFMTYTPTLRMPKKFGITLKRNSRPRRKVRVKLGWWSSELGFDKDCTYRGSAT
ncbi:uncharacterized protein LOC133038724 [Cannabis sativa]|uniref:uncharacterized protein LOC133038724 n=1 Tax=Cannabis sativa TaxID=3483 RepID=UPI0029CA0971|nr:uncharacterized protein LOC133038724 [Cannabis sativa]